MDAESKNGLDDNPLDDPVCAAVRSYLAENPRAMDTLEGIVAWWLPRQQIRFDVARVSRALEVLQARGVVEAVGVGDAQWYRLRAPNQEQSSNIEPSRG